MLQNYEDILTSSIIGTFQYLSSPKYIQSVLELSLNLEGTNLTFDSPIIDCHYVFWPKLENSEPDVLLQLRDNADREYLISIEAKYWSDKSSSEDRNIEIEQRTNAQRDQLAREIEDLYKNKCYQYLNVKKNELHKISLIYLTNHTFLPFQELSESVQHIYGVKHPKEQVFWLPWRNIHQSISRIKNFETLQDKKLLGDLVRLLEKKGLQSFGGFKGDIELVIKFDVLYNEGVRKYSWNALQNMNEIDWKYGGNNNG